MDRVLWEAGGVEAIGLQVVTIQYWRPELGCREGAESGPSLATPVGPDTTRSTHSSEPQQTVRKAERGHSAVPCRLRWYVSGGCTFESSPARQNRYQSRTKLCTAFAGTSAPDRSASESRHSIVSTKSVSPP